MTERIIQKIHPLGFQWETSNPFLFCAHHKDAYPIGNGEMGPAESLAGRQIGQDFDPANKWRMYHGQCVPGFPEHPHRGFETVTIVLEGYVDHFDSMGAAGRYGKGDVQWMTAGSGMQHAEMFPLVHEDRSNPLELFQIWLNLPRERKMVPPHYRMLWAESIPVVRNPAGSNGDVSIRLIAGEFGGIRSLYPAPDSWAADPQNRVAIWLVNLGPGGNIVIPADEEGISRTVYCYEGDSLTIANEKIAPYHAADVTSGMNVMIGNGDSPAQLLILQGRRIDDPVAQHGPFVMNTQQEIHQTIAEFQQTRFGGWPWDRSDPVFPSSQGRIARFADGTEESRS